MAVGLAQLAELKVVAEKQTTRLALIQAGVAAASRTTLCLIIIDAIEAIHLFRGRNVVPASMNQETGLMADQTNRFNRKQTNSQLHPHCTIVVRLIALANII